MILNQDKRPWNGIETFLLDYVHPCTWDLWMWCHQLLRVRFVQRLQLHRILGPDPGGDRAVLHQLQPRLRRQVLYQSNFFIFSKVLHQGNIIRTARCKIVFIFASKNINCENAVLIKRFWFDTKPLSEKKASLSEIRARAKLNFGVRNVRVKNV